MDWLAKNSHSSSMDVEILRTLLTMNLILNKLNYNSCNYNRGINNLYDAFLDFASCIKKIIKLNCVNMVFNLFKRIEEIHVHQWTRKNFCFFLIHNF